MGSMVNLIVSLVCGLGCCGFWILVVGVAIYAITKKKGASDGDDGDSEDDGGSDDSDASADSGGDESESDTEDRVSLVSGDTPAAPAPTPAASPAATPPAATSPAATSPAATSPAATSPDKSEDATEVKMTPPVTPVASGATIIAFDDDDDDDDD